ncbi:nucleotidyltransferase substrate binding protein (plasmid) [Legionella adelaidensis]|uniref:Nucleotidyltransferase substrate binding protein n=1 Tax=Legionella adelaidensis TaxID=45056 RepID=A0A0W0R5H5_9GAMM|nr:HI0074 family nucleotidyltransferase substrate-binding subunit [Legionella adelaidensis]KTC66282.1 nucleotidyltransferase substrate binding protein [Legionella adelaidensis]VEH84878.1 nucleotidyltransferase substrate binding protein [Legionella adelaidensis]
MSLNLRPLQSAVTQLQEAIDFSNSDLAKKDSKLFNQFRNSVIQCFEFSYELCWRMIKRQLELDLPTPSEVDQLNFNDMMRTAAERGYVENPVVWMRYRKLRNVTFHAYDEKLAQEVYEVAILFLHDAKELLRTLQTNSYET